MRNTVRTNRRLTLDALRKARKNFLWVIIFFLCAFLLGTYLSLKIDRVFYQGNVELYQAKIIKLEKELAEARAALDLTKDEQVVPNPVYQEERLGYLVSMPVASYHIDTPDVKKKYKRTVKRPKPLLYTKTIDPKPLSRREHKHENPTTTRVKAHDHAADQSSSPVYRIQVEVPDEWRTRFEPLRLPVCETDRTDADDRAEGHLFTGADYARTD